MATERLRIFSLNIIDSSVRPFQRTHGLLGSVSEPYHRCFQSPMAKPIPVSPLLPAPPCGGWGRLRHIPSLLEVRQRSRRCKLQEGSPKRSGFPVTMALPLPLPVVMRCRAQRPSCNRKCSKDRKTRVSR